MDDIRVGPVSSYDSFGERPLPSSGKRRRNPKTGTKAEATAQDFFDASEPEQEADDPIRDYFASSDRAEES